MSLPQKPATSFTTQSWPHNNTYNSSVIHTAGPGKQLTTPLRLETLREATNLLAQPRKSETHKSSLSHSVVISLYTYVQRVNYQYSFITATCLVITMRFRRHRRLWVSSLPLIPSFPAINNRNGISYYLHKQKQIKEGKSENHLGNSKHFPLSFSLIREKQRGIRSISFFSLVRKNGQALGDVDPQLNTIRNLRTMDESLVLSQIRSDEGSIEKRNRRGDEEGEERNA